MPSLGLEPGIYFYTLSLSRCKKVVITAAVVTVVVLLATAIVMREH